MENPYASPTAAEDHSPASDIANKEYGGIGRLSYFAVTCVLMIVLNSIFNAADRAGRFTELQITILYFVTSAFYCPATYYRLKNIGTNPWWCLLNAVPLVSFLLMARCVIFPKGYADTQSMDKPATIMIAIVFATFVIAAVCVAVYYRHGFSDF